MTEKVDGAHDEKDNYCLHIFHQCSQNLMMMTEKVDGNRKSTEKSLV